MANEYSLKVNTISARPRSKRLRDAWSASPSSNAGGSDQYTAQLASIRADIEKLKEIWKVDPEDSTRIYTDYNTYSKGYLSSYGVNEEQGEGGGGTSGEGPEWDRLDIWSEYAAGETDGWVLSAKLGWELHNRLFSVEDSVRLLTAQMSDIVSNGIGSMSNYILVDGSNGTSDGVSALVNKLGTGNADPTDDTFYLTNKADGGDTYYRRPHSYLYNYIKKKLESIFVKKSGDTVTGPLNVVGRFITRGAADSTNKYYNYHAIVGGWHGTDVTTIYENEVDFTYNGAANPYFRVGENLSPIWKSNKIWHAGNDGSGSGLDADTLDGLHAMGLHGSFTYVKAAKGVIVKTDIPKSGQSHVLFRIVGNTIMERPFNTVVNAHWGDNGVFQMSNTTMHNYGYAIPYVKLYFQDDILHMYIPPMAWGWYSLNVICMAEYTYDYSRKYNSVVSLTQTDAGVPEDATNVKQLNPVNVGFCDGTLQTNLNADLLNGKRDGELTAAKLQTTRKIWGQNFDGTADVSGAISGATDITASGKLTIRDVLAVDGVIRVTAANESNKNVGFALSSELHDCGILRCSASSLGTSSAFASIPNANPLMVFSANSANANGAGASTYGWMFFDKANSTPIFALSTAGYAYLRGPLGLGVRATDGYILIAHGNARVLGSLYVTDKAEVANSVKIGQATLTYDTDKDRLVSDKPIVTESYLSAYGSSDDAGSSTDIFTADTLTHVRKLWGQPFDGSADVNGSMEVNGMVNALHDLRSATSVVVGFGQSTTYNGTGIVFGRNNTNFAYWDGIFVSRPGIPMGNDALHSKALKHGYVQSASRAMYFNTTQYQGKPGGFIWAVTYTNSSETPTAYAAVASISDSGDFATEGEIWCAGNATVNGSLNVNGSLLMAASGDIETDGTVTAGTVQSDVLLGGACKIAEVSSYPYSHLFFVGVGSQGIAYFGDHTIMTSNALKSYKNASHLQVASGIYVENFVSSEDGFATAGGYDTVSDERLKQKLSDVEITAEQIAEAPSIAFAWKQTGKRSSGTLAQYWQPMLPDVVNRNGEGWLHMDYGRAAMHSVIAVARKTVDHERRIRELENELATLKAQM